MKKLTPVSFNSITLKVSNGWATVEGQLENGKTVELIRTYCEDTIVHHTVHPSALLRERTKDDPSGRAALTTPQEPERKAWERDYWEELERLRAARAQLVAYGIHDTENVRRAFEMMTRPSRTQAAAAEQKDPDAEPLNPTWNPCRYPERVLEQYLEAEGMSAPCAIWKHELVDWIWVELLDQIEVQDWSKPADPSVPVREIMEGVEKLEGICPLQEGVLGVFP